MSAATGSPITTRNAIAALVLFAAGIVGPSLFGERLEPPPNGMTYYFMVLHEEDWSTGSPKRINLPDVAKHGGKVVRSAGTNHVVLLPKAAASRLRADENVAYLQRIWMGESFDDWSNPPSATTGKKVNTDAAETDLSWATGEFDYDGSGNVKKIGADTYAYDSANRLIEATVNGKTESFEYDSFGNLTRKAIGDTPTTTIVTTVPVDSSSNRVTTWTYDVAGNVLSTRGDAPWNMQYYYDALGMMTAHRGATGRYRRMIYTADDERIGVLLDNDFDRWKLRDFNGRVLREFHGVGLGAWVWIQDYVYAENNLVAGLREEDLRGKRHFHLDHLGSVRLVTTEDRTKLTRTDYYPFGAEQTPMMQERSTFGPNQRSEPLKFTGHERDYHGSVYAENDDYLDYMHARFYDPHVGRFLSVDPTWASADLGRPQSWNRYSYVLNNPILYTDPDGRCAIVLDCVALGALGKAVFVVGTTLVVGAISETEVNGKPIGTRVREFILSGGGSSGEMAAERFAQNMANHMAEQADLPELPARDATGKIHTNEQGLPTAEDLQKYPTEDLQHFQDELKGSVEERIKTTSSLPGQTKEQRVKHGERQTEEQRLIKAIDKIIRDRE